MRTRTEPLKAGKKPSPPKAPSPDKAAKAVGGRDAELTDNDLRSVSGGIGSATGGAGAGKA